ncbi:MAG: ABC transporter permease [Chloroflexi bacterium]|nr:ABC transporter permease [Chloroflexota bacterium]MYE40651.1 ABC transporter permease [Chloroflexota bacterium]
MQRFLVRRLIITFITLLAVSLIIFIMARASGDPRTLMLSELSTGDVDQWEELGEKLGLNKPYYEQYGIFLRDMLTGNFGKSIKENREAADIIWERLVATFQLGMAAFAFSLIVGIPLGILSSVNRGGILDNIGKVVALIGQSAPPFWIGIMLIFFFAVQLGWVPPSGREDWKGIILPAVTLGWFFVAANMRLVRSAMLDVLDSEYVKLARAKGVSSKMIIWKHALRNALIPPLTFAGVTMGSLVAGSLTTEVVFAWPGLGRLAVNAMLASDYPVLQGVVITYTVLYVGAAFLVDVLYAYIDPRIRYT